MSVTTDGVKIGNRIYWRLTRTARYYTSQITTRHRLVFSNLLRVSTSRCLVATSDGRHSSFSGFRNYPQPQLPASHSNSSQQLNCISLTNSLTPLTDSLTRPAHNISSQTAQKPLFIWECNCCRGNMLVCAAVTWQRLLYSCLFRGRCLATGLHVTMCNL
jgi:hypothetical protein